MESLIVLGQELDTNLFQQEAPSIGESSHQIPLDVYGDNIALSLGKGKKIP